MTAPNTHNEKWQDSVKKRQREQKEKLLEALIEQPIIQLACKKCGISPATYYRWIQDRFFKVEVELAHNLGRATMNDFVESKLVQRIREDDMGAIKFYLDRVHPEYQQKSIFERDRTRQNDERQAILEIAKMLEHIEERGGMEKVMGENTVKNKVFRMAIEGMVKKLMEENSD